MVEVMSEGGCLRG